MAAGVRRGALGEAGGGRPVSPCGSSGEGSGGGGGGGSEQFSMVLRRRGLIENVSEPDANTLQ